MVEIGGLPSDWMMGGILLVLIVTLGKSETYKETIKEKILLVLVLVLVALYWDRGTEAGQSYS